MSTKKVIHGSITTKKNASNLPRRTLEEPAKNKTKKKPTEKEQQEKNTLKNVPPNVVKLKKDAIKKLPIKTKPEVPTSSKRNTIVIPKDTERPLTATLSKPTIVNENKIGPDITDNYEDDFESYESDFEEYSSSSSINIDTSSLSSYTEDKICEDDKNLDSGHFEMPEYKHKPLLDNIKEAIEKENNKISSPSASLSDEGFEDHKSFQFVDFADAQIRNKLKEDIKLKQKRGEQILSMVRLDSFSFTLFDLSPVSYEQYNYGTTASTQTGDDDIDEEIQTDDINYAEKYTQQPESYNKYDITDKYNKHSLNNFLSSTSEIILRILEESNVIHYKKTKTDYFSKSVCNFKIADSYVTHILCPSDTSNRIITVHRKHEESLVAIWNVSNCDRPDLVYSSYGIITSCAYGVVRCELIFTGLEDGTILVWNSNSKVNNTEISRIPLFSTGIKSGHYNKIIGLNFLDNSSTEQWNCQQTNEICSIDEIGEIILWTIMFNCSEIGKRDKISLIQNTSISLCVLCPDLTDLFCTNFSSSSLNPNYLFITTNYGLIIHYVIKAGSNKVKRFFSDSQSLPKSLECCPFSSEYFLAGYENGNISLFTVASEKPLITLSEKDRIQSYAIEMVQWSKYKSTVIYAKDENNMINIWDLNESDMFPIYSFPYKENIKSMKINLSNKNLENKISFMFIGTNLGNIYLHNLNEWQGKATYESHEQNIKTFFNYVKIL